MNVVLLLCIRAYVRTCRQAQDHVRISCDLAEWSCRSFRPQDGLQDGTFFVFWGGVALRRLLLPTHPAFPENLPHGSPAFNCVDYEHGTCTCMYYDHSTCCTMIIVHACSKIILHACTMTIVHAGTMIIVHACMQLIVHACTMIKVHACIMMTSRALGF